MNIVFGLCGNGSRFIEKGFSIPKYLISMNGAPMIYHAVETLKIPGKKYFVVRQDHLTKYKFLEKLLLGLGDDIIVSPGTTEGAAQTLLLTEGKIDQNLPFISVNCDQYMKWNSYKFLECLGNNLDTSFIITYKENSPACSYVRKDGNDNVIEVREKKVISNDATVGIYHWSKTSDFFEDAKQMIKDQHKENNEYYVAPVYNYSIKRGLTIKTFEVKREEFWPVGTPQDLNKFFIKNIDLE